MLFFSLPLKKSFLPFFFADIWHMVRNQQAWVLFHEGHQQNKNNDKNNNISNGKNDEAQTHAQISVKLRYINSALNDNFRG